MKQHTVFIYCIIAVIFAGGGFFGGMKYQQTKTPQLNRGQQVRSRIQEGMVNGVILSIDANIMTVTLLNNSSKNVILGSTATYTKSTDGSQSDLKVGDRVNTFGTTNVDGSVTAQFVQINPPQGRQGGATVPAR